jgi:acyl phosphate:glycerol-3-phosphate acyltransferase
MGDSEIVIIFMISILLPSLLAAYAIGGIPFGFLLSKLFLKIDIRTIGSGNIGATNVLRTGNKLLALLTLFFDSAKGAVICLAVRNIYHNPYDPAQADNPVPLLMSLMFGVAVILGHCFPIWLKFKGGKGVSTALGVLLAAVPVAGLAAAAVWIGTLAMTRISSASALAATAVAPIVTLIIYGPAPAVIVLLIALLVTYRHKENIQRLLKGEEPKVGKKKHEQTAS